ncbi:MAG: hypothetical protein RR014_05875 [Bilophila sp.]
MGWTAFSSHNEPPPIMRGGWLAAGGYLVAEIEATLRFDSEKAHEGLQLETDRNYGQTRILVWHNPQNV